VKVCFVTTSVRKCIAGHDDAGSHHRYLKWHICLLAATTQTNRSLGLLVVIIGASAVQHTEA
jgi:hypothetical protein